MSQIDFFELFTHPGLSFVSELFLYYMGDWQVRVKAWNFGIKSAKF